MNMPDQIDELEPNQVFVFGSNEHGHHAGGAARFAFDNFGAQWGVGEGLTGQSYAIPTMGSPEQLAGAVARFLSFAEEHPDTEFLVTKIGTGIAGIPVEDVAPLFAGHPENVIIPLEFEPTVKSPKE